MSKFDFNGLTFQDRHTYGHYKTIKKFVEARSSTYTHAFAVGESDHCIPRLERQFKREGYFVKATVPIEAYDPDTGRMQWQKYLTVGTSITVVR